MARQDLGAQWIASINDLALAYGLNADDMQQRVYALAEQIHTHYCFSRGFVTHSEARPDEHIAAGILGALAGADWWMVRTADRIDNDTVVADLNVPGIDVAALALAAQAEWDAEQEAKVDPTQS